MQRQLPVLVMVLLSLATCLLVWVHRYDILFWDTVQFAGKHGLWYYEQGLTSGFLPAHLNSGHPPTFGIYQAAMMRLFGKSLATSHLSMLPFLLLNLFFTVRIGRLVLDHHFWLFPLALCLSPFYLGHSILVSPDLVLITGFLACLYGLLSARLGFALVGAIILSIISIRGQMVLGVMAIYFFLFRYFDDKHSKPPIKQSAIWLGLPTLFTLAFHLSQHFMSNWEGMASSPWAPSLEYVSLTGWLRNVGIFGWRVIDHGMLFPIGVVLVGFRFLSKDKHRLIILAGLMGLMLFVVLTPRVGLLNHRYFMPLRILIVLMALQVISIKLPDKKVYWGGAMMIVVLFASNRLIYPDTVAQGWDSTAAHWPFYQLEKLMDNYMTKQGIKRSEVGTAFPLDMKRSSFTLETDIAASGYKSFDLQKDTYILYSNVMNEFQEADIAKLSQDYRLITSVNKSGLVMQLYERRK